MAAAACILAAILVLLASLAWIILEVQGGVEQQRHIGKRHLQVMQLKIGNQDTRLKRAECASNSSGCRLVPRLHRMICRIQHLEPISHNRLSVWQRLSARFAFA
jgi:hypothetical protein